MFEGCSQVTLLELDDLSNDNLGVRTVCASDPGGELSFAEEFTLGKFEYAIHHEVRTGEAPAG